MRLGRGLWIFLLVGCGAPEAPQPPAEARRIVSLLPSFTEILVELGAADRLVGCTEHCRPDREVTRVPWQGAGAAEAILRTRPDLVLRQEVRTETDPVLAALARSGIYVLTVPSETIADVKSGILRIGGAVGKRDEAMRFVETFNADLLRARAGALGKDTPKVLFVFGRDQGAVANVTAAGPGSFLDELIRFAGGRNILEDLDSPYPAISLELIVRRGPQVIIDNVPGKSDPLTAWRASVLAGVPAVRDRRVFAVHDPGLLIPGPRLPAAVRRMVEMIHGPS